MPIYSSITQLVGGTPLLELGRYAAQENLSARLLAKIESANPAGSAKDRIALAMIEAAEARGVLQAGATIIEPTSGNTGIGLAAIAAAKGYRLILVMPESMSRERRMLLRAYGAELVLTPAAGGMQAAVDTALQLSQEMKHSFYPSQFENPANPNAHYRTTGPEIWRDSEGSVDVFVAGVGTGGTLSGVGRYLKEQKPGVEVIAVEPAGSPLLSKGESGAHGLQGIGANFVPNTLSREIYDRVLTVNEEEAYTAARAVRCEGLLVGISSGAALYAAGVLAKEARYVGKTIVVLFPDGGERYLSTPLFEIKEDVREG